MSKSTFRNSSINYFFNACFDKNQLKNLISWFIKSSGEKITVDFLETIKQIGFHQATQAGVSLGFDDLEIPLQKSLLISQAKTDVSIFEQQTRCGNLTIVEKTQGMISTWNQTSEFLTKAAVQQFKNTNPVNPVYMMAFSGARGNISQVRQLVAMRGLMADPQGGILEFPIQSNFREGLTLTEYLISCYGARKGLVDTALRTATAGYLTRRLVDAAQHVIVSAKDCGTKQGIRLRNPDLEQQLIGRVLLNDLVINQVDPSSNFVSVPENDVYSKSGAFGKVTRKTVSTNKDCGTATNKVFGTKNQIISPTLAKLISKKVKQVFVRSPLTCQVQNSICQLCYGWDLAHGDLVNIGEAVGVIAAQSIGEPGTQLTMRTFHTGGVGVFSDQAMKYFRAPYDGIIEYTAALPGHFIRTPHGKIVYMIKNSSTINQSIVFTLKPFDTKQIQYSIENKDLPTGSLLLVRHGEYVKTGQVVAQSSQFKKSKQIMPESTHLVFSPMHGEISLDLLPVFEQKVIPPENKKTKQKKQEQIGPVIRRALKLGDLWVFSYELQQEGSTTKSILRPGDLVSQKTSLFQHDFYITDRRILDTILKKWCLGLNLVSLSVEKINFHKRTYSIVLKNSSTFSKQNKKNQKEFLFFPKKRLQNFLIWFPKASVLADSGYFLNFLMYSELKNNVSTLFSLSNKDKKNFHNNWFHGSFFYFKANIQKWKIRVPVCFENSGMTFFLNLKNQKNLKHNLLLQYHPLLINFSRKSDPKKLVGSVSKSFAFGKEKQTNGLFTTRVNNSIPLGKEDDTGIGTWTINPKTKIKTKFFYSKKKNYIIDFPSSTQSDFLTIALSKVKSPISSICDFSSIFFQEKKGWVYIPLTTKIMKKFKTNQKLIFLEPGKIFDNFLFLNSKISIQYLPTNKIGLIKSLKKKNCNPYYQNVWYSKESFLIHNSFFYSSVPKIKFICDSKNKQDENKLNSKYPTPIFFSFVKQQRKKYSKCFLYYKVRKLDFDLKNNKSSINFPTPGIKQSQQASQNTAKGLLFVSLLNEFSLPQKPYLMKQWNSMKKTNTIYLPNSPLFTKQKSTIFQKKKKLTKKFQLLLSGSKGWFSEKNIFKLLINLNSRGIFSELNQSYFLSNCVKNHKIPVTGLNLFFYNFITLPLNVDFYFEIFENRWVIPNNKITTGFIRIKKDGEFRLLKSMHNKSVVCILTRKNIVTLDLSKFLTTAPDIEDFNKNKQLEIGTILRSGTEIFRGVASSTGGIILNKNFTQFSMRLGISFLASPLGIIHVFDRDLIQKNDRLLTLKSRLLQTEDIVQGIPKIEQLFEARQTQGGTIILNSMHTRLKKYLKNSLRSKKVILKSVNYFIESQKLIMKNDVIGSLKVQYGQRPLIRKTILSLATTYSIEKIQFFLVQSILQAYSSQGVKLSQKHIEIIVREMTIRVRIVAPGYSGLFAGDIIPITEIEKIQEINDLLLRTIDRKSAVLYEPIIIGITKSVFQSQSFLLSASFQEVSRVLVRSALSKKTDFLRGLHENVIVGQFVPAGTGLISSDLKIKSEQPDLKMRSEQLVPTERELPSSTNSLEK